MVDRRASDAAPPLQTPIAPVAKRKRRASCLGEQERRERKRAIDREAQRSLREKTKTHIAELERTIQILRDQDRNGATASLLSEIDSLRVENERLRDVIDSVKSVVGLDFGVSGKTAATVVPRPRADDGGDEGTSPAATSAGHQSPKPCAISSSSATKPCPSTPIDQATTFVPSAVKRPLDLDGMTVMTDLHPPVMLANQSQQVEMELDLQPVRESSEEGEAEDLPWGNAPATATWAPMMEEIFGPNWRCPSPTILHIGNPDNPTSNFSSICPVWKKSNELFGKVFTYHHRSPGATSSSSSSNNSLVRSDTAEAGLLYLGIKQGWDNLPSLEWMKSPALTILKQVDELLFKHLPNVERLAVAYKSFKLLKYYLNATKEELDKVPHWLRPSFSQSSTSHPIALDFFAWPTIRSRLLNHHTTIFQTSAGADLSSCYSRFLRFDWPFAFEDAFFLDEDTGMHYPSPLFERYHGDLKYWSVDEQFFDTFPEMRGDIEGDQRNASAGKV
ncbi:unnamed protein product [Alternaria alternata]|uniref:BZIP domain-containing protein n=1 Tax=Alternaria tenuissima TaxID=119927 RepID=A0A4Q4M3M2_9PLEO|nr:hypothetical protein AA0114_g10678 [Alternaria tenuissima]RYN87551.1 hypothetical protein AA0120_g7261 [Alternaria tenuissima]